MKTKLIPVIMTLIVALSAFVWVTSTIKTKQQAALQAATEQLQLTRDIRIAQLKSDVKTIYSEIRFWAESKPLREGMQQLLSAWQALGDKPNARVRQLYISDNPLSPNYSEDYVNAKDGSLYSESHQRVHTLLKGLTNRRGYYDVLLIANTGDVVYSVFKQDDFGSNLISGKYNKTTLAQGFREVQENTNLNHVALSDFIAYAPSKNLPVSFIQTSIVDEKNKTQGVLAFQLPVDFIDAVITNTAGLGDSTQVMAVGSNHLLRNRIDKEVIKTTITSDAIDKALAGKTGVEQTTDYKGVETITAYAPFEFSQNILGNTQKNTWAIIVKQDVSSILKPVEQKMKTQAYLLAGIALIALLLALFVTREKEALSTTEKD